MLQLYPDMNTEKSAGCCTPHTLGIYEESMHLGNYDFLQINDGFKSSCRFSADNK